MDHFPIRPTLLAPAGDPDKGPQRDDANVAYGDRDQVLCHLPVTDGSCAWLQSLAPFYRHAAAQVLSNRRASDLPDQMLTLLIPYTYPENCVSSSFLYPVVKVGDILARCPVLPDHPNL
jgi:hypothetical protein